MVEHKTLYQNVTAADFDNLQSDLTAEHFQVTPTSVDSFTAIMGGGLLFIKGLYHRNQQTLELDSAGSDWFYVDLHHPGLEKKFLEKNLNRVAKKDNVSGDVQPKPVETPVDRKTGLVDTAKLQAETEAAQEKLQKENDKSPMAPLSTKEHEDTKSVTVAPETVTGKVVEDKPKLEAAHKTPPAPPVAPPKK